MLAPNTIEPDGNTRPEVLSVFVTVLSLQDTDPLPLRSRSRQPIAILGSSQRAPKAPRSDQHHLDPDQTQD